WRPAVADGGQKNRPTRTALNSCLCSLLFGFKLLRPSIPMLFKLVGELAATGTYDAAAGEHVHVIGHDVIKKPLIVSDDDQRAVGRAHPVDAVCNDSQRVDVQAGIR